jgi:polar amino acid transport system ATP-binding protein
MVSEVLNVMVDLAGKGLTMAVVTHEMRFARDASTRVFYMDQGECWEAGPPEQIFEHPKRQETHDFVFRVRGWQWTIDSLSVDEPALDASLTAYCQRQFMGRRATNACQLLVEEVVGGQLMGAARSRRVTKPNIQIELTAGEGGVDMVLSVDYRGALLEGGDPLGEEWDPLSRAIVEGLCERKEQKEPGVVLLHVKQ